MPNPTPTQPKPTPVDPAQLEYYLLTGDQLSALDGIIRQRGWASLNHNTACAIAAYAGRRMVGFHVLQQFPHAEPLYVEPDYRGTGLAEELANRILRFIREVDVRGFMVVAESEFAAKLCEDRGMKRVEHPVYVMTKEMMQ